MKPVISPKRGNRVDPVDLSPDQLNDYFFSVGVQTRESVLSLFQRSGMGPWMYASHGLTLVHWLWRR